MKQQINLFQAQFRREKKPLAAATLATLFVVVVVALAALHGWQRRSLAVLEGELATATQEEAAARAHLAGIQAHYPGRSKSSLLEEETLRLAKELAENRRLAAQLAGGEFGDSRGFSGYFEALARQHVAGTWLTRIAIGRGGRTLALEGHTLQPEFVPAYAQRLAGEAVLRGKSFSELELRRTELAPAPLDFLLSAGGAGATEERRSGG